MGNESSENIKKRLEKLEQRVNELQQQLDENASPPQISSENQSKQVKNSSVAKDQWKPNNLQLGEHWLNRLGIGLLLIGIAFLFKYSIDQGWLIPPIRSAIGLGIGLALFGGGIQMKSKQKPLKQIMLGGGIATFYITGFATFQLYAFVPQLIVWTFMVVVTLLALSLSLQQDEPVLSVVGTLGALGTPFMLYTGEGNVLSLVIYTALVFGGTSIVYLRKGWIALLWSMAVGGLAVMGTAVVNTTFSADTATMVDLWSLQLGVFIWMGISWMLPVFREQLRMQNPDRWPDPNKIRENIKGKVSSSVYLLVFLIPLMTLIFTIGVWELSMNEAAMLSIGLAVAGGLFYLPLKKSGLQKLGLIHTFLGLVMLTLGLVLLLEGNFLFAVLTVEMIALRYVAFQTGDSRISGSSHLLFGILILWLFNILRYSPGLESLVPGIEMLIQLALIAGGGILIPKWLNNSDLGRGYKGISYVIFLMWLYQNLVPLENGQALITMAWGIFAVGLLVIGFMRYSKEMRLAGMITIFIVVGKLFIVDLSQLEAIWRILMFMGFGAVLLLLGYYWQSKRNSKSVEL